MSRIKPILFFAVVILLSAFLVLRQPSSDSVNVGDVAPDFSIKDPSGQEIKLSDYRGNLVFLNFWYTDCVPCVTEMPDMEKIYEGFKDRKFKMMAVSIDIEWEKVEKFYQDKNLSLPAFHDPGRKVASRYNVYKFPETYLIDGNGIVLKHYIGAERWTRPQVLSTLEEYVKTQEAPARASQ